MSMEINVTSAPGIEHLILIRKFSPLAFLRQKNIQYTHNYMYTHISKTN